uniref:RS10 protein n=1 Tax=Toxocara canis TaxID=6265 RepID=A0A183URB8_TOXCA
LQSLFGPFFGDGGNQSDPRDRIRNGGGSRFGAGGGGSRWPDRGGPRGDESQYRRQIGRLPRSSGISAPPMSCLSGG